MAGRLSSLFGVLRPRTIARTVKSVDDLASASREIRRRVRDLEHHGEGADARVALLEAELRDLRDTVAELVQREARLRAIYRCDVEQQSALAAVDRVLDLDAIRAHVERCIESAVLCEQPFPHMILEELFPPAFYEAVRDGIPPVELFDGSDNKQRIVVPFDMAPAFSRRVWGFLLERVIDGVIGPAVIRKFRAPLGDWFESAWPGQSRELLGSRIHLQSTDGRILLRRRGYVITPHRDPRWGWITCLLYLARPGDRTDWGTQLYEVDEHVEATSVAPLWIRQEQCRLVKDVPFRPNSALVFLNSRGAHGASIPADAEPPDLERYVYQFRIGPTGTSIRRLLELLPEELRKTWSGKAVDYN
jgi:hypothetical protein